MNKSTITNLVHSAERTQKNLRMMLDNIQRFLKTVEPATAMSVVEQRKKLGLYTVFETANKMKVSVGQLQNDIATGKVPRPSHKLQANHKRSHYAERDLLKLRNYYANRKVRTSADVAEERRKAGFWSIADVAHRCGVATVTIQHHVTVGRFQAPTHPYHQGPRQARYYATAEMRVIEKAMKERKGFGRTGRRGPRLVLPV